MLAYQEKTYFTSISKDFNMFYMKLLPLTRLILCKYSCYYYYFYNYYCHILSTYKLFPIFVLLLLSSSKQGWDFSKAIQLTQTWRTLTSESNVSASRDWIEYCQIILNGYLYTPENTEEQEGTCCLDETTEKQFFSRVSCNIAMLHKNSAFLTFL